MLFRSRDPFWWKNHSVTFVDPFDYPNFDGIQFAADNLSYNKRVLDRVISKARGLHNSYAKVIYLSAIVQNSLVHNPVFQPSEDYSYLNFKSILRSIFLFRKLQRRSLILDPLTLFSLGEARCGQVAQVLKLLFQMVGLSAKVEKLNNHIVTVVSFDRKDYIIDADAFKNDIFFYKSNKGLYTREEILRSPEIVDGFKPTGWPFRWDSIYALNSDSLAIKGYVDFYCPEKDGLLSYRYGRSDKILPPGIPCWHSSVDCATRINKPLELLFDINDEDFDFFKVRIGLISKGYSKNNIIFDNLSNETCGLVEEKSINTTRFIFNRDEPGDYYVTVRAVKKELEGSGCYLFWSDELKVSVRE